MKLLRTVSLIALSVALGVGFFASTADAAVLDSVRVTRPDSGAIRGIDSVIVADVFFRTTGADSANIKAYVWLATASDKAAWVRDSTTVSAIEDSVARLSKAYVSWTGGHSPIVAAMTTVDKSDVAAKLLANTMFGDADSVIVAAGPTVSAGKSWKVTFFLPVNADVGTLSGVALWGAVFDNVADPKFTSVQVAKRGHTFRVDGDRPANPDPGVTQVTERGGTAAKVMGVTAFSSGVTLVGIGDSVKVTYDLGSQADAIILAGDLTLSTQLTMWTTGVDTVTKSVSLGAVTQQADVAYVVVTEGLFGNASVNSAGGYVGLFLSDMAGNLSSSNPDDDVPGGLTQAATFVIDGTKPAMDSAAGDTLIPVDNDTITDGGFQLGLYAVTDLNWLYFNLGERLDSLIVMFDGETDYTYRIKGGSSQTLADAGSYLRDGDDISLDLTYGGTGQFHLDIVDRVGSVVLANDLAVGDTNAVTTGVYTLKFTPRDMAGNVGATKSRTNVYVDVTDITLTDLFPTKAAFGAVATARLDTIEDGSATVTGTANVQFKLSEPADSVLIKYTKISGSDAQGSRTRRLASNELANTTSLQSFKVDSLVHNTVYALNVVAKDLAGNFTMSGPDTFLYDTSFVVPLIQRFSIAASQKGIGTPATAGGSVTLTLTADATTDGTRDAVTYKAATVLRITGGTGVTLTGDGVTDSGAGMVGLDADNWSAGKRTVTLKDTTSIDSLVVTIYDSTSGATPLVGQLDSLIVYQPAAYNKIIVATPATVTQGVEFQVDLTLADTYGNERVLDDRYVQLIANKFGIEMPEVVYVENGDASFMAKATGWTGTGLTITALDLVDFQTNATPTLDGTSAAITVEAAAGPVATALDAPDTLDAQDYMGADGAGDQGGFILLTWDLSADHADLTGYRIYRSIQVNNRAGGEGEDAIVTLETPASDWIPWAKVDAVSGESIGRAIVATLDNVETYWAIAAERGSETTAKEAFDGVESVSTPYELMASTMVESRTAAQLSDGPVLATLTPEAFAYIETGVAPRLNAVDLTRSALTQTVEPVRAIDNIPPAAVAYLRAMDTPSDAGSSVTVTWTRSTDDRQMPRAFANAVGLGAVADHVAGVEGYNIYRRAGSGEYVVVGRASAGESSFGDITALNGVRYTYQVRPYDSDNETVGQVERTAMAIRNNVTDSNGQPIHGLFGADAQVGFDDFFLFADTFGMTAEDEAFEPAFNLAPNADMPRIDFDDFFVFADNFGRTAGAAGKVVPMVAGLNTDARLYLDAGSVLPSVGDEVAIDVNVADFVELKGYGFTVSYEADKLEFVRAVAVNNLLGEGQLAQPQLLTQTDGEVSVAAFGETVSEGDVSLSLVFRTKTEIENTFVDVTESEVRDGSYSVNQTALPAPVQIQTRPESYALGNNYPNPFNPATTIKYALPEAAFVKLEVYNVVGQVVRTLVADHQNAGRYVVQWDASDNSGHSLSSGIYFYRLQAGGQFLEVKKMLLLK